MKRQEIDACIDQIIAFSECEEFIDTPVKRYSSGMYVKLAFAVAAPFKFRTAFDGRSFSSWRYAFSEEMSG